MEPRDQSTLRCGAGVLPGGGRDGRFRRKRNRLFAVTEPSRPDESKKESGLVSSFLWPKTPALDQKP